MQNDSIRLSSLINKSSSLSAICISVFLLLVSLLPSCTIQQNITPLSLKPIKVNKYAFNEEPSLLAVLDNDENTISVTSHSEKNDKESLRVRKTNKQGELLWQKQLNLSTDVRFIKEVDGRNVYGKSEFASGLFPLNNKYFIVTGRVGQYGLGTRAFAAKLDSDGHLLWKNPYGSGVSTYVKDSVALSDGSFILFGKNARSSENFDLDAWCSRIDQNGNVIWDKNFEIDGNDSEQITDAFLDSHNKVTFVLLEKYSSYKYVNWIVTINDQGYIETKEKIDIPSQSMVTTISNSEDGSSIIGYLFSESNNPQKPQLKLAKINTKGLVIWDSEVPVNQDDYVLDLKIFGSYFGKIIVVTSKVISFGKKLPERNNDWFASRLIQYSQDGELLDVQLFPENYSVVSELLLTPNGNFRFYGKYQIEYQVE